MFFHGIVAVGTQGGRVYLVDLALDGEEQGEALFWSQEENPATLCFIRPCERIADIRQRVLSKGQHLTLTLNESALHSHALHHRSSISGKAGRSFP